MNPPLRTMLRFLVYTFGGAMERNVIEYVLLVVYDLSAEKGGYRLFVAWGRNWYRHASVCGSEGHLHEYNHMAPNLVVET